MDSLVDLSKETNIVGFRHFLVHSPSELIDGRAIDGGKESSCSGTLRKILHLIPLQSTGFVVIADWYSHDYYATGTDRKIAPKITAAYIYNPPMNEGMLDSENFLKNEAISHSDEDAQQFSLRLAVSCLKHGFTNAGVAIIGSERDIKKVIAEGNAAQAAPTVDVIDRAAIMYPLRISDMPPATSERNFNISMKKLIKETCNTGNDAIFLKSSFHFGAITKNRTLWNENVLQYARDRNIEANDMHILICIQKFNEAYEVYLPGGKRELGEETMDALRREVKEESGVPIEPIIPKGPTVTVQSKGIPLWKQSYIFDFKVDRAFQSYMIGIEDIDI